MIGGMLTFEAIVAETVGRRHLEEDVRCEERWGDS